MAICGGKRRRREAVGRRANEWHLSRHGALARRGAATPARQRFAGERRPRAAGGGGGGQAPPALSASSRSVTIRPLLAMVTRVPRPRRPPRLRGRGLASRRAAGTPTAPGMPRSRCGGCRWCDRNAGGGPGPHNWSGKPCWQRAPHERRPLAVNFRLRRYISFVECRAAGSSAQSLPSSRRSPAALAVLVVAL